MGRFGPTCMKKMIDNNTISEKFILDWYNKEISLDKDSMLRDKNAEKKFRNLIADFFEWLATAENELGESMSPSVVDADAEDDDEDQIKDKGGKPAETEKQRKMREVIEKQRKQQEALLEQMKLKSEKEEAEKQAAAETRIDATAVVQDENVDIDDI